MNKKLRECPRCGAEGVTVLVGSDLHLYQAKCWWDNCLVLNQQFRTEEEAVAAWDQRNDNHSKE